MLRTLLILTCLFYSFQVHAVTLKIATLAPDGTGWMKAMRTAVKDIDEQTGGRVKVRFYPGGVMGNERSVLRKIRIGQLQLYDLEASVNEAPLAVSLLGMGFLQRLASYEVRGGRLVLRW